MNKDICEEEFYNDSLNIEDSNYEYIDLRNNSCHQCLQVFRPLYYIDIFTLPIYLVIIVGGFFGNVSVILTVATNKSMKTTINIYVVNLAIADAIICIICGIPHALFEMTDGNYILGRFMCVIDSFSKMTCLISSVLTLSAISWDRAMAILFPLRARVTKHRSSILITIIWIISILISLPLLLFKAYRTIKYQDGERHECMPNWPVKKYYDELTGRCQRDPTLQNIFSGVLSITLFFLPLIIMVISYSLVLFRLGTVKLPGELNEANVNIHSTARKRVNKMVFVVLVAFVVCWSPSQMILLFDMFRSTSGLPEGYTGFSWEMLRWISEIIAYANSFINPIIYGWYNKSFREGFCILLRCKYLRTKFGTSGIGNRSHLQTSFPRLSTALSSLGSQTEAFITRIRPRRTTSQSEREKTSTV